MRKRFGTVWGGGLLQYVVLNMQYATPRPSQPLLCPSLALPSMLRYLTLPSSKLTRLPWNYTCFYYGRALIDYHTVSSSDSDANTKMLQLHSSVGHRHRLYIEHDQYHG